MSKLKEVGVLNSNLTEVNEMISGFEYSQNIIIKNNYYFCFQHFCSFSNKVFN